jgi:hypothetical protein
MSASIASESASLEPASWFRLERRQVKILWLLLGLAFILAGNHVLRRHLEHTRLPYYPIFPDNKVPLTWRLLLPTDMGAPSDAIHAKGNYHWFTTGLTVVKLLEQVFTPNTVFYTLNAVLIVFTFGCSWLMFRSAVFSYTVAICLAFGTQFYWVYVCSPIVAASLFLICLQANLLCLHKVLRTGSRGWQIGYAVTLIVFALNHEQWLDYLAFVMLMCGFLWLYARRAPAPELKPRLLFVAMCTAVIAAAYLSVRLQYGQQTSRPGDESEMIFAYGSPVLATEDFFSNILTYLYIAVSNYFPPFMVGSNSLYLFGPEGVVAAQNGYHPAQSHLVAMHHVFYWYFFAGMVFTVFVYFLVRNARAALNGSQRHTYLTAFMLLVTVGFAIHALVKYRPYMSVPLLTYKCMNSNLGMAYLIGYCLMDARRWISARKLYPLLVALVWGVIVYGALARPAYLSFLSQTVGMTALPDPMRNLISHR